MSPVTHPNCCCGKWSATHKMWLIFKPNIKTIAPKKWGLANFNTFNLFLSKDTEPLEMMCIYVYIYLINRKTSDLVEVETKCCGHKASGFTVTPA